MGSDGRGDEPALREESRAAQGRALELLISVVVISALLGLAINLGSGLLAQVLTTPELLLVIAACAGLVVLAVALLIPRIATTIKEFHEDIEIVLPLLVGPEDVEVVRVTYYGDITETAHAALARRPAEERKQIAQLLQRGAAEEDARAREATTAFALELAQFLFAVQVAQGSRRLLGPEAAYHKFRDVARAQSAIVPGAWEALARQSPGSRYLAGRTQGVPEKTLLPGRIRLRLPEVAPQVFGKVRPRASREPAHEYVTLLTADAGRDTALAVRALASFSDHGLPTLGAPHRGLTTRCILRNARDAGLRELAQQEEAAANLLTEHGRPLHPPAEGEADPAARYAALHARLYEGGRRPRLLRIFVQFEGMFRIRLLGGEGRQRGPYAWGTGLSRILGRLDIEVLLAILKENGQKTPRRTF